MNDKDLKREVNAHLKPLSRRRFLKWGVDVVAVLGAAGVCIGVLGKPETEPLPAGINHLSENEYAIFKRFLQVAYPVEGTNLPDPLEIPTLHHLDAVVGTFPPHLRSQLGTAFGLFNYAAVVVGANGKGFTSLDDDAAKAYCEKWATGNSIQRGVMMVMKKLCALSYWGQPPAYESVGFEGPVTKRFGYEILGNAPMPS
jgi:hypothetical protein